MKISLKWIFIRWFFKYLSPVIGIYEKKAIGRYAKMGDVYNPIFIVGPPRSGSTILFQLLTKHFDVSYINNFVDLAREVPFTGFVLNERFFNKKNHNSFTSEYGKTRKGGLIAPNEGLFWHKWLPKDRHYVNPDELSAKKKKQFKDCFNAIMNKTGKPLLIKNLAFSMRLELIKELFPNAKIIHIKRDPIFIAQSIYIARKKLNIPESQIWSIRPRNYKELEKLPEIEMIVKQVFFIEKEISEMQSYFKDVQFFNVNYEELQYWERNISTFSTFLDQNTINSGSIKNINVKVKQSISDQRYKEIIEKVGLCNWSTFIN